MDTKKASHTPGPWHVGEPARYGNDADRHVIVGGNAGLAYLSARSDRHLPCEANARLIAAAPEMLDALQAAAEWAAEAPAPYREFPFMAKVRAAIAKAEG